MEHSDTEAECTARRHVVISLLSLFRFPPKFAMLEAMLFSPRISTRELAGLCHRLATAMEAGIDARTIWSKEVQRAKGYTRSQLAVISRAIDQGESIRDALRETGEFFPVLFREMVAVGEQTGRLDAIFYQLARDCQERLTLRRKFMAVITWPVIELGAAVVLIGFLIWIMGVINSNNQGIKIDPLGFGLLGNSGLAIYATFVIAVVVVLWMLIQAIGRGLAWTRPIQRAVMNVPMLGKAVQTLALARLAWSLNVTLQSGMEIRRALKLSLSSTNNAMFTDKIGCIDREIERGSSIHEAFVEAGCFPVEFLDAMAVGEQSGKLDDSMAVLSRQYQEQAQFALKTLNTVAAFLVWMIIASIIIILIFRLAFFYLGTLNQLGLPG
jgi:type II secretory pathway component PulF